MTQHDGIRFKTHGQGLRVAVLLTIVVALLNATVDASQVIAVLPDAPSDALMILLPPRSRDTIRDDLDTAGGIERESGDDRATAEERLSETRAKIVVCESEIEVLKARVKLVKEQENSAEQADLERQIKAKELQLKALGARKDMREAERDLADSRRKTSRALSEFLKKELNLVEKRDALVETSTSRDQAVDPAVVARLQTEVRDLERQCLDMLKELTEKRKDTVDREKDLLDKRLRLHDAQRAILVGPK